MRTAWSGSWKENTQLSRADVRGIAAVTFGELSGAMAEARRTTRLLCELVSEELFGFHGIKCSLLPVLGGVLQ